MFWDIFRLTAYGIGVIGAAMLTGKLFSIDHILAKLWGVSQMIWMLICAILITMLAKAMAQPSQAVSSREVPMIVISVLLAICPLAIYVRWGRNGELEK